jgi:uncharacterized protein YwqG
LEKIHAYPQLDGKSAKLLAQINFSDLKQQGLSLEDFPEEGILQFFLPESDDMWGLRFKGESNKIQVIYYKDTKETSYINEEIKNASENNESMPYQEPCILNFEEDSETLSFSDQYQSIKKYPFKKQLSRELSDYIYDEFNNAGSKLGGYAYFTQDDPRAYKNFEHVCQDWILLLQIDSEDDANIMWGDCGVANWFIEREDLKKRDFSKVLFNWGCY